MEKLADIAIAAMWPTTVLLLAWILRNQLRKIGDRLEKAKLPGGTELEFGCFVDDQLRATPGDTSVAQEDFKFSKCGNVFWLGADLLWTYDALLRRADGKYVLHGLQQALHHLRQIGFANSTSERSLAGLLDTIRDAATSGCFSDPQRISSAVHLKNIAHQIGASIESFQAGFDGGLETNKWLSHEERMKRIGR